MAEAIELETVGIITQNRHKPDGAYLIGSGKLEEIRVMIEETGATVVIFDNELVGSKNF